MLFRELLLYTCNLEKQKRFYSTVLGLELISESRNEIQFNAGSSKLIFRLSQHSEATHIAFNISSNKIEEADLYLKDRVPIIPFMGKRIVEFPDWNARSLYFYDRDQNVLELIARKNIKSESDGDFTINDILSISEIGLPVYDIELAYGLINQTSATPIYDGDFTKFCAAGDEQGLLILINKNYKTWFPGNDPARDPELEVKGDICFQFHNSKINITSF